MLGRVRWRGRADERRPTRPTDGCLWVLGFSRIGDEEARVNALDVQYMEPYDLHRQ